jgi:hypothetical protein
MSTEHLTPVVCVNPATGQRIPTTKKVFESIYIDKGFELVDDNANDGVNRSTTKTTPAKPAKSVQTGTAASIAATLGLGDPPPKTDGDVMTFSEAADKSKASRVQGEPRRDLTPANDAGSDVEGDDQEDANETNANGSVVSDEREPNKRDRGRG